MILVTGATGFIGRHVVARLKAAGYPVRVFLTKDQARLLPPDNTAQLFIGTLLDDEALFQAVTGVHTVIHLASAQWWGNENDLERVDLVGTRNLMEAARAARVGRVLMLSHLGATPASAYPLLRMKGGAEEVVKTSGLAYTILRSGVVFGEDDAFINHIDMQLKTNMLFYLMPGRGEVVLHPIYIDDLVTVIEQTLENMDTVDQVIEVGGPEYITLHDLIRTVMRVSGNFRVIIPTPPYLLRWLNRVTRVLSRRTLITPQWLDLLATNRTASIGTLARYYDLQPHRLEDTLLNYLPGNNNLLKAIRYGLRQRPERL